MYLDHRSLGRMQIPSMQSFTVLEDRDDGTLWVLSHRSSDDRIGITELTDLSTFLQLAASLRYEAFGEPYIGTNPTLRLIVRGGRLGVEISALEQGIQDQDQAQLLSREKNQRYALEVIEPTTTEEVGRLAWTLNYGTSGAADV